MILFALISSHLRCDCWHRRSHDSGEMTSCHILLGDGQVTEPFVPAHQEIRAVVDTRFAKSKHSECGVGCKDHPHHIMPLTQIGRTISRSL